MSYQSQMAIFYRLGMSAIDQLMQSYSELGLSWDEKQVADAIVSYTRLHATELPTPADENEMYSILEKGLAQLIVDGKIRFADFGLSTLGREEFNRLVALVAPPTPVATVDPREEFSDVVAIFNGPTTTLNQKMKVESFRSRFNQAVAAGVI
jgi:hypothetical protein